MKINVIPQTLKIVCAVCGELLDVEVTNDSKISCYPCKSKECISNPSRGEEYEEFLGASAYAACPGDYETTEYDVYLIEYTSNKVQVLQLIRNITNLNVVDSFKLVNSLPQTIATGISKWDANDIKKKFESLGAKIEIKGI